MRKRTSDSQWLLHIDCARYLLFKSKLSSTAWFVPHLVKTPDKRFCRDDAHRTAIMQSLPQIRNLVMDEDCSVITHNIHIKLDHLCHWHACLFSRNSMIVKLISLTH